MVRETLSRVWICWMLMSLAWGAQTADAHSCHEVKTAFQLRQIGPIKWVPETTATDAELQICKHQGPTCCTRRMEEGYHTAARRDTLQNILSYNLELKYLILSHAAAFQDTFHSLLTFTLNHTLSLLDLAYTPIAREGRPLVSALFSDLDLYLQSRTDISISQAVRHFYDELFPLVYRHLVNPGLAASSWSVEGLDCLRATRQDLNPFGPQPQALVHGLERVLGLGRALLQALTVGVEVLNATESAGIAKECGKALVRMQYCPHCRGLTLIRPCHGLCLNVMRGCLAGLAELQGPWSRYIALLEGTSAALAGGHELELTLLGIRERINDAILNAQLQGPLLSAVVEKVCGSLTESASSTKENLTTYNTTTTQRAATHSPTTQSLTYSDQTSTLQSVTSTPPSSPTTQDERDDHQHSRVTLKKRSLPLKPSKHDKPKSLKKLSKEFMVYIQRYKSFFSSLPELLCEGEMVVDEYTCWNGEDLVESYTGLVVGNGLRAQRQNPEIKVKGMNPVLVTAKQRLENFNQGMWVETGLNADRYEGVDGDSGSGISSETSGECDDEDGCEASGEVEDKGQTLLFIPAPSLRPRSGRPVNGGAEIPDSSSLLLSLSVFLLLLHST